MIEKSLFGNWREEHLFTLGQSGIVPVVSRPDCSLELKIERLLQQFDAAPIPSRSLCLPTEEESQRCEAAQKGGRHSTHFDLRTEAYKLFGVDVTQIPGLESNVLPLFSEIGRDIGRWPLRSLCFLAGALPRQRYQRRQILWRGVRKANNRAGEIFRLAAQSLHRSQTPLGDYLRRLKARFGPAGAITATARKIATLFYTLVRRQVEFDASLWQASEPNANSESEARLTGKRADSDINWSPLRHRFCKLPIYVFKKGVPLKSTVPLRRTLTISLLTGLMVLGISAYRSTTVSASIGFQPVSPGELKMTSEPLAPGAPAIILYREVDRDDNGRAGHGGSYNLYFGSGMQVNADRFEDNYYRIKDIDGRGAQVCERRDSPSGFHRHRHQCPRSHHSARRLDCQFRWEDSRQTILKRRGFKFQAKTFTLPDVQVGSIIEYSYTISFNGPYFFSSHWILSNELFTRRARFSLRPYQNDYVPASFRWTEQLRPGTGEPKQGPDGRAPAGGQQYSRLPGGRLHASGRRTQGARGFYLQLRTLRNGRQQILETGGGKSATRLSRAF